MNQQQKMCSRCQTIVGLDAEKCNKCGQPFNVVIFSTQPRQPISTPVQQQPTVDIVPQRSISESRIVVKSVGLTLAVVAVIASGIYAWQLSRPASVEPVAPMATIAPTAGANTDSMERVEIKPTQQNEQAGQEEGAAALGQIQQQQRQQRQDDYIKYGR